MKIAIIGSGISGLACARKLNDFHDVTVFEKADRLGGHTATKAISWKQDKQNVDTGFIVFNDWTYPNFIGLMDEIGVASQVSVMSFSVSDPVRDFEYSGDNLNTLFAKRRNLFSLPYWNMLREIVRFNKELVGDLEGGNVSDDIPLGHYLVGKGYGKRFRYDYIVPMASAIWSATYEQIERFPIKFFARFFKNHGLLSVNNRPTWRVIKGGSCAYLKPLVAPFQQSIRLEQEIKNVYPLGRINSQSDSFANDHVVDAADKLAGRVIIEHANGRTETYDRVVFACHSDEALKLIKDPDPKIESVLGALPYADNSVILHTDTSLLPKRPLAWAAWNYRIQDARSLNSSSHNKSSHTVAGDNGVLSTSPILTYNMNILQGLHSDHTYCVSLNADELIDPSKIIGKYSYAHPQFDIAGIGAQKRWSEIDGVDNMHFCGAYWANGFHEDGVVSGLRVAHHIDSRCPAPIVDEADERYANEEDFGMKVSSVGLAGDANTPDDKRQSAAA